MWKKLAIGLVACLVLFAGAVGAFLTYQGLAAGRPDFFESEIAAFEAEDDEAFPAAGGIVFVGSSSIRLWDTLAEDMAPLPIIQRGFGGAHMEHVLHNAARIVVPYDPRAVVVFVGGNDLGSGKSPERVIADFTAFVTLIRSELPAADLWLFSMKPSILRVELMPEMQRVNIALQGFAAADPQVHYLHVADVLLGSDGLPDPDHYIFDGLHLSAAGYARWTSVVRPPLLEAYGPDAEPSDG